eukprot:scaffold38787_cov73-Cyclotella_meneghiniana.AAC.4
MTSLSIPFNRADSERGICMMVVDEFGGKGNVLNFNVGDGVKFALPNVFWTRLTSKYGTSSVTNASRPSTSEKTGLIYLLQMQSRRLSLACDLRISIA